MTVDLEELRDSARQVIEGAGTPAEEDSTWAQVVELGWLLVAVPEELGGLGLGAQGACALHVELGRGLAAAPFGPAMLALDAVCASGLADRDRWVERITTGEYVGAPLAGSTIRLEDSGGGKITLTGVVEAVLSADKASHAVVWTADGDAVALAPLAQSGLEVIERPTWDATRRLFDLQFDAVALGDGLVLARGDAAAALAGRLLAQRDFALAADAVGGANALLELTVEHLQTRRQFGRPLALFQALKHRCADLKALVTGAEALLFDALAKFDGRMSSPEAESKGEAAKLLACSTYAWVAEEALQLHGGIGMASEHPCHLFLKRALLNDALGRGGDCYAQDIAEGLLAGL